MDNRIKKKRKEKKRKEKMKENRILALSLRPKTLNDLIGQDEIIKTIDTQFESHRIPHFYILSGPVGCGKTTLARILSRRIHQIYNRNGTNNDYYETKEINAANQTGIDDIRKIIEHMSFKPLPPSKVKIVILDEAHQLSIPAQNALITETEDVSEHVFYIFCTSEPKKIIPALQRRAFNINPKIIKKKKDIFKLVQKCADHAHFNLPIDEFVDAIITFEKFSPGLIIQAAEKYFSGLNITDSLLNCGHEMVVGNIDMMAVCRSVIAGKWPMCAELLKNATRSDTYGIRASLLGYLKSCLLKSTGSKAINIAKAIRYITDAGIFDETTSVPSLLAALCLACAQINVQ